MSRRVGTFGFVRGAGRGAVLAAGLAACTPVAPPAVIGPPVAAVALTPVSAPLTIVDPPVQPGSAVLVVRGAEPHPVATYEQPARISPPGAPTVLPPPIPRGDRQETVVEAMPQSIILGGGEHRRLVAFLKAAGRGRNDAVHLEMRGGSKSAVQALVGAARRAGVDPLKIRIVETGRAGRIEVIATAYVASAPVCPSLAIVGPSINDNDFDPTHGCSNRANLAAMVNDPADLLRNDAVVASDGAYAAKGIERYRSSSHQGQSRTDGGSGQAPIDNGFAAGSPGGSVLGAGGQVAR